MKIRRYGLSDAPRVIILACRIIIALLILAVVVVGLVAVLLRGSPIARGAPPADSREENAETELKKMAKRYAPIIFQEVDRGGKELRHAPRGREDFITAVDFDGDLKGANNWDNQSSHPLLPVVYYSLLQTATHTFISYSIFHPRDWSRLHMKKRSLLYSEHENDMESIQVVVERGDERQRVLLLLSQAHLKSHFAAAQDTGIEARKGVHLSGRPIVLFDENIRISSSGTHVGILIERKGHAIYSLGDGKKVRYRQKEGSVVRIEKKREGTARLMWERYPVVQYVPGDTPREPAIQLKKGMDQEFENGVPYVLESIYHTFWTKFEQGAPYNDDEAWALCGDGQLFDQSFNYRDALFELTGVPRHFDSDKASGPGKRDAGISPFALGLSLNPLKRSEETRVGLFFFNPAAGYKEYFRFPGAWSEPYTYNPYFISPLNMKRAKYPKVERSTARRGT